MWLNLNEISLAQCESSLYFSLFLSFLFSSEIWLLVINECEDNQREEEIRSDEQSGVDGQCQTQTGRGGQKGTGQTTALVSNSILFC